MVSCIFCGNNISKGTGKVFVRDNGQVLNFCSGKCEKNMLILKRDARKLKWTKFFVKGEVPKSNEKKKAKQKNQKSPVSKNK